MPAPTLEELRALGAGDRAEALRSALAQDPAWPAICRLLTPADPFPLHQRLYATVSEGRALSPAWYPEDDDIIRLSPLIGGRSFAEAQQWSVAEPEAYWSKVIAALKIAFRTPPRSILDVTPGPERARWLPGAQLNIAESCFARRDWTATAIIWQSEGGGLQRMTVGELYESSTKVARSLRAADFSPGDAIAIDMPMTVESVVIYLGIVLAGCAVVSIADSFAPEEIATRLQISGAAGVFTQDVILRGKVLPLYARVCAAQAPRAIVLSAGDTLNAELRAGDCTWEDFLAQDPGGGLEPVVDGGERITNILFSSGTTGTPKAIPWTQLTPIKAAADGFAHHDIRPGDVVAWPTNLGWMMGPWLIYASLLNEAAIALFQGNPSSRSFATFIQDAEVTMLGVVPSLVRAWRAGDVVDGLDWSRIRCFSSTGEASSPDDMLWLMSRAGYRPVIEYCGGTEIGGGYITGSMLQPQVPSAFSTPAMGCGFLLIDAEGHANDVGEVALTPPMLGTSSWLLNRDHHAVYFAGMPAGPSGEVLRRHGDQMEHLGAGYYRAQGRVDDTMNLGGIKVSSAEIERVCAHVEGIRESAAIALTPSGGGPAQLVVVVVLEDAPEIADLQTKLQRAIRGRLNPLFKVHRVVSMDTLPRTASGKVMRRVLRAQLT
ncbi:MAG: AMP-binding protein [Myxococcota bacterium]|nr:AMP-binding protein [Myxococcota bacterium]